MSSKKYIEPYPIKAKLLAWSELNVNEVDMILNVFKNSNLNEINIFLENFLNLNPKTLKEKALMDLHYYAIKFALNQSFSKIQLSAFVSIVRALHRANQETPFDNYNHIMIYFENLMICHTVKRPPYCLDIFDSQKSIMVIDFIKSSYLKHYKLYKFSFTPKVALDLKLNYVNRSPSPDELDDDEYKDNNDVIVGGSRLSRHSDSQNNNFDSSNEQPDTRKEMREYIRKVLEERIQSDDFKQDINDEEQINLLRQESLLQVSNSNSKIVNKK